MRPSRDPWFLEQAAVVAKRSTCLRRSVGCVLVNARGHMVSTGYNGVASGLPHCNEPAVLRGLIGLTSARYPNACPGAVAKSGTQLDACHAVHAEQNALLQCRDVYGVDTAYVTVSPCVSCVKLLLGTGCHRIVFAAAYSHDTAASLLWTSSTAPDGAKRSWVLLGGDGGEAR